MSKDYYYMPQSYTEVLDRINNDIQRLKAENISIYEQISILENSIASMTNSVGCLKSVLRVNDRDADTLLEKKKSIEMEFLSGSRFKKGDIIITKSGKKAEITNIKISSDNKSKLYDVKVVGTVWAITDVSEEDLTLFKFTIGKYNKGDKVILTTHGDKIGKITFSRFDPDLEKILYNVLVSSHELLDIPEETLKTYYDTDNPRDLIIYFLKEKNRLINDYMGKEADYIKVSDICEISNVWLLSECIKVIEDFSTIDFRTVTDVSICPWCICNESNCSKCGYGLRNGKCKTSKSVYSQIIKDLGCRRLGDINIYNVPGIHELVRDTVEKSKELLRKLSGLK